MNDDKSGRSRVEDALGAVMTTGLQGGYMEQMLSDFANWRLPEVAVRVRVETVGRYANWRWPGGPVARVGVQGPKLVIFVEHQEWHDIAFSGSATLPGMASGGTVLRENLPAKDRRTVYLLAIVVLWLIVFALPMLALDPDLSPRGQTVLGYEEAALIAFAAGYTFWIFGRLK
jgi:hypothetical protein